MIQISKKMLLLNIILSQAILVLISAILIGLIFPEVQIENMLRISCRSVHLLVFLAGSALLLGLQLLFHYYISKDHLTEEINILLVNTFSLPELAGIFFFGALTEEILFRGILQPVLGILAASLLFTLIHFRYLKKVFLILEVFLMGLILGSAYFLTGTVWVPVFCHFTVNILTACLIKKGYLQY